MELAYSVFSASSAQEYKNPSFMMSRKDRQLQYLSVPDSYLPRSSAVLRYYSVHEHAFWRSPYRKSFQLIPDHRGLLKIQRMKEGSFSPGIVYHNQSRRTMNEARATYHPQAENEIHFKQPSGPETVQALLSVLF